ncbi:MAG TPA: hypothetical protein VII33_14480 [Nakamurella sp.]
MTTATKPARPRSAHNGVEHTAVLDTAVLDTAVQHDGGQQDGPRDTGARHTAVQHDGAAATDAALARIVTETVAAALRETTTVAGEIIAQTAVALGSAASPAKDRMPGGVATAVKTVAGLTVDTYRQVTTRQLAIAVVLADAVHVNWVSELTHRNADAIGELVAVSAGAAHELLE